MNKKGATELSGLIMVLIIAIIFFVILGGGGFSALLNVGSVLSKIPSWGWIGIGVLLLLSFIKKKK